MGLWTRAGAGLKPPRTWSERTPERLQMIFNLLNSTDPAELTVPMLLDAGFRFDWVRHCLCVLCLTLAPVRHGYSQQLGSVSGSICHNVANFLAPDAAAWRLQGPAPAAAEPRMPETTIPSASDKQLLDGLLGWWQSIAAVQGWKLRVLCSVPGVRTDVAIIGVRI